ncbi:Rod binding protein [compost metagenome]
MRPEDSGEEGGLFSGEQAGMFMDFFDQALGKQYATNGGNALVEQLVAQLTRQQEQSAGE